MNALDALAAIDLNWTARLESIWDEGGPDAHELHATERERIVRGVRGAERRAPMGLVVLGEPGIGKTHLYGSLRRALTAPPAWFFAVDMSDVRDFWETTRAGYLTSLQRRHPDHRTQALAMVDALIAWAEPEGGLTADALASAKPPRLINRTGALLDAIGRRGGVARESLSAHKDVLRALVLLANDEFTLSDLGYAWLRGLSVENNDYFLHGFQRFEPSAREVVAGLAWIGALTAPAALVFDALDPIVSEARIAERAAAETSGASPTQDILVNLANGLLNLLEHVPRTQVVVACVEQTWAYLADRGLRQALDRYREPILLPRPKDGSLARAFFRARLDHAFSRVGFAPADPTWPVAPSAFDGLTGLTPRELLRRLDAHIRSCLDAGYVTLLESFDEGPPTRSPTAVDERINARYAELQRQADPQTLDWDDERLLDEMIEAVCVAWRHEVVLPDDVDVEIDRDFAAARDYDPLHARVRRIDRGAGERERHLCLRFLEKQHPRAFQARLKAAIDEAGISRSLVFRRLVVFRRSGFPSGAVTAQLLSEFEAKGGVWVAPTDMDLRTMHALRRLLQETPPGLAEWFRARAPTASLSFEAESAGWLFGDKARETSQRQTAEGRAAPTSATSTPEGGVATTDTKSDKTVEVKAPVEANSSTTAREVSRSPRPEGSGGSTTIPSLPAIPLGERGTGGRRSSVVLPLSDLCRHAVVLAGAGSGKTVFLRRLVEEAAVRGVPSIVIDGANDLARLGERWPSRPEAFSVEDEDLERRYFEQAEVILWTPGRNDGNPLTLPMLPDLAAVAHDAGELEAALHMSVDTLGPLAVPGGGAQRTLKLAVLREALAYFARDGGGNIEAFLELLVELPSDVAPHFDRASSWAHEMGQQIRARRLLDPLYAGHGVALDPGTFFGIGAKRTRVSVVNLSGLPSMESRQRFVNQLAMSLFVWMRSRASAGSATPAGLVVVDEARDFAPSGHGAPSLQSLITLTAQARKYGLGLIFATQHPTGLDNRVVVNCKTQLYGAVAAPAALQTVRDLLRQHGGEGHDIPQLQRGTFYAVSASIRPPVKVSTRLCVSHHGAPMSPDEIRARAAATRPAP